MDSIKRDGLSAAGDNQGAASNGGSAVQRFQVAYRDAMAAKNGGSPTQRLQTACRQALPPELRDGRSPPQRFQAACRQALTPELRAAMGLPEKFTENFFLDRLASIDVPTARGAPKAEAEAEASPMVGPLGR